MGVRRVAVKPRRGLWLWLFVYDDIDKLRAAAQAFAPAANEYADAMGVAHGPYARATAPTGSSVDDIPDDAWEFPPGGYIGTVRLWSEFVSPEVIIHECLHMALRGAMYLRWAATGKYCPRPGLPTMEDEEDLCYLQWEIIEGIYEALGKGGLEWR